MATEIRHDVADPETDPGWDYTLPNGGVHGAEASIAMWTWARKGLFPPATRVREKNTEAWRTLTEAAPEITVRARAQFARELFLGSENTQWYWISPDGGIDSTSYTGVDMLHYLESGYLPGETQLCGVAGQRGVPSRAQFKRFSQVLEEFMGEKVPLPRPFTPRSEGRENGNALVGNSTAHSNGNIPVVQQKPPPGFADLQTMYSDELFGDNSKEWYTWFDNRPAGPFPCNTMKDLSSKGSLPNSYPLKAVPCGSAPPPEADFKSFEDLLLQIHSVKNS